MDRDITCAEVENLIYESCEYVTDIRLFDVYEGTQLALNKKSMAFTVVFTPKEEEFTPEMIDGFVDVILKNLNVKHAITLRV